MSYSNDEDEVDPNQFTLSGIPELDAAKILHNAGNNEEALSLAKKALKKHPDNIDLLLLAGAIHFDLEKFDGAEKYILKVLSIAPNNSQAIFTKIMMKMQTGRSDDVFADILRYLELIEWNAPGILAALPRFATSEDEKKQIPQILRQAWFATLSPEVGFVYAKYLRTDGEYNQAKALLEMLENHLHSTDFYNERGIVFGQVGDLDRAIQMYGLAISMQETGFGVETLINNPEPSAISQLQGLATYLSNRSGAYLKQGDFEAALKDADVALSYDPQNGYHWLARAKALEKLGKYADFFQLIQDVLNKEKETAFLLLNEMEEFIELYFQVRLQLSTKEPSSDAAISASDRERLLDTIDSLFLNELKTAQERYIYYSRAARFFDASGQAGKALEYYEKTRELILYETDPDFDAGTDWQFLLDYFFLLHKTGNGAGALEKIIEYFKEIIDAGDITYFLPPYYPDTGFGMELDVAASVLEQVHQAFPESLDAIDQMFYLRLIQKDYKGCIQLLERALQLAGEETQPGYLNNLGYIHLLQGDFEKARTFFDRVIVQDSSISGYHGIDQGVSFFLNNTLKYSTADFFGNPVNPFSPGLWVKVDPVQVAAANLCAIYMTEGDYSQAVSTLQRFMGIFLKQSAITYEFKDRVLKSNDRSLRHQSDGSFDIWAGFEKSMASRTSTNFDLPSFLLLTLAIQGKDKIIARWVWKELIADLPDREQDVEFFSKAHSELYTWLTQD